SARGGRGRRATPPPTGAAPGAVPRRDGPGSRPPSRRWRRTGPGGPGPRRPWGRDWPGRPNRNWARWRQRPPRRRRGPPFPSHQYGHAGLGVPWAAAATIRPLRTGGPMASTPPLHGLRIIEASALGPAAITTALVDLGADVIKV